MIGREPYECTCGDPGCVDCNPTDKLQRDLDEALDAIEYVHSGQNERYARGLRIKLLIKHGRIKEST